MSKKIQDGLVDEVKSSNGELVLDFYGRVGARPYARYHDGEWDVISLSYVPEKNYGEDGQREIRVVDLEPEGIDEEKIREMVEPYKIKEGRDPVQPVDVIPVEESPFAPDRDIPAKDEVITTRECDNCLEEFRDFIDDPYDVCPVCDSPLA